MFYNCCSSGVLLVVSLSSTALPDALRSAYRQYFSMVAIDMPMMELICGTSSPASRHLIAAVHRRPCSVTSLSSGMLSRASSKCLPNPARV
jgi:hypothetical protein